MKLKNKIALIFYSLFILFTINGSANSVAGNKEHKAAIPSEQILQTFILASEGIVQPVFQLNEITTNAFRAPSSFYKASAVSFSNKISYTFFSVINTDQTIARTPTVPLHIIFRVLLV